MIKLTKTYLMFVVYKGGDRFEWVGELQNLLDHAANKLSLTDVHSIRITKLDEGTAGGNDN